MIRRPKYFMMQFFVMLLVFTACQLNYEGHILANENIEWTGSYLVSAEFALLSSGILSDVRVSEEILNLTIRHFQAIEKGDIEAFWLTMISEDSISLSHQEGLIASYFPALQDSGLHVHSIEMSGDIDWLFRVLLSNAKDENKVIWMTVQEGGDEELTWGVSRHLIISHEIDPLVAHTTQSRLLENYISHLQEMGFDIRGIEFSPEIMGVFRVSIANEEGSDYVYWTKIPAYYWLENWKREMNMN